MPSEYVFKYFGVTVPNEAMTLKANILVSTIIPMTEQVCSLSKDTKKK